ncbi:MAG: helix-turn-helix transcriptional regulator [Acidobacteria bacterium]|nr:helix-turn-helix transcriptional regulator [Acidobacteriota bacterium]
MFRPKFLRAKAIRLQRGQTQSQVARLAHMSQPTYARIEVGRLVPTTDELARIAAALQIADALSLLDEMNAEPEAVQP